MSLRNKYLESCFILLFAIIIIYASFSSYNLLFNSIICSLEIWLYKIVPPIATFYIIVSFLMASNLLDKVLFIFKQVSRLFHFDSMLSFNLMLVGILIGNPSASLFYSDYYQKGLITKHDYEILIYCGSFVSPLFIYSFFNSYIVLFCHIFSNFVICWFLCKKNNVSGNTNIKFYGSFFERLNNLSPLLLSIASVMIFITICKFSLQLILPNRYFSIALAFLELCSGLTELSSYPFLSVFLLGFGGLAIHGQILNVAAKEFSYFKFFIFRIIQGGLSVTFYYIALIYANFAAG